MQLSLHKPSHPLLVNCIDYFLFIKSNGETGSYKTFSNTNTCLALYKQTDVDWDRNTNTCRITDSRKTGSSRLFGFHKKPFVVNYSGDLEQVCILFKMEGLLHFTGIPIDQVDLNDHPFAQLFGVTCQSFIETLFSVTDEKTKLILLEDFLVKKKKMVSSKKQQFIQFIKQMKQPGIDEEKWVSGLASNLLINSSTLYRNFMSSFGQSPNRLYKTLRFRKTLTDLLARNQNFTKTAYANDFYDQAHLIKDIKQFTGERPGELVKKINTVGNTMMIISSPPGVIASSV